MSLPKLDRHALDVLHAKAWGCSYAAHIREYAKTYPKSLRTWAAEQILLRVVCLEYGVTEC